MYTNQWLLKLMPDLCFWFFSNMWYCLIIVFPLYQMIYNLVSILHCTFFSTSKILWYIFSNIYKWYHILFHLYRQCILFFQRNDFTVTSLSDELHKKNSMMFLYYYTQIWSLLYWSPWKNDDVANSNSEIDNRYWT